MPAWKSTSEEAVNALRRDIRERAVIPFIGSGASYSAKLPSWRSLVNTVGEEVGFDAAVFDTQGDAPQLFDYYLSAQNKKSLSSYAATLNTLFARATVDFRPSPIHKALVAMNPTTIYTTNWDDLLERSFEEAGRTVHTVVTYAHLATPPPSNAVEIIKFHGDFSAPETMVLTESQYFERMGLDTAMDVRLRADALGRALLFIGHSLTDVNVRYLLFRLNRERLRNTSGSDVKSRTSYIVSHAIGEVQKRILKFRYNVECIEIHPNDREQGIADVLDYCVK